MTIVTIVPIVPIVPIDIIVTIYNLTFFAKAAATSVVLEAPVEAP